MGKEREGKETIHPREGGEKKGAKEKPGPAQVHCQPPQGDSITRVEGLKKVSIAPSAEGVQ
ncbi:hypothetical protein AMTR_s00033p00161160 [Amborella trichopoda]|uniref:Uncharacterized protein n=1 Tax=Amborella trichopoda TaxID=13333 RepID=U5CYP5_AMBTC|nr:hypothetical protein AMTR_s00033p00161160 [Amborella trichopoda]